MRGGASYVFGPFRLEEGEGVLLRHGVPVALRPKDFEMLLVLVQNAGHVVSKDELLAKVWPDTVIEEGNLARNIFNLRRALADGSDESRFIETIPKRGYRFIAPVTRATSARGSFGQGADRGSAPEVPGWPADAALEFDGLAVIRSLGDGTMGRVFLAREPALERLIAVKILRPELAADAVARTRFSREALAAARLSHPNVTAIFRVGELTNGTPYIAQEYVEGRTLAQQLEIEGARSAPETHRILRALASALAAADDKRVIHRDVKPGNVLIERGSGRVVLTDFGIAGLQETGKDTHERLTRAGEQLGDPRYASPEHIRAESLTARSDIYSVGVVAYELLSTRGPYGSVSGPALVNAHLHGTPIDLDTLLPDVTSEFGQLLARCVAKKAEDRPTAAELVRLLDGFMPDAASTPTSGSDARIGGSITGPSASRLPVRSLMVAVGVAILVILLIVAWQRLAE